MVLAVQNERDRISIRRTSYEEITQSGALSVSTLLNAEMLSRQVSKIINFHYIDIACFWKSYFVYKNRYSL